MKKMTILLACLSFAINMFGEKQSIAFTWTVYVGSLEKSFFIEATTNEPFTVNWGDGNTEDFTGNGYTLLSHTYTASGGYTLAITGVNDNCLFTDLEINRKSVTALDVSKNTALTALSCGYNSLTSLDVSKNTALTDLWCDNILLTALDVSKNTALTSLSCNDNLLTSLDVSKNMELTEFWCNNNQLTALDISKNIALTYLECRDNAIPLSDLYAASQKISNPENKYLGTQRLPAVNTGTNVAVVVDNVFNGVGTVFTVKKNNTTAILDTDYSLSGGEITFLQGVFTR
jgi:hypothetical protein